MNMDFNSQACGVCCQIIRTYQKDNFIVSNEKLLEFTINGNYYYIQKQTYSKGKHRWCYTIMDAQGDFAVNDFSYTKRGIMQRFSKWYKEQATIIWQSPEMPQGEECREPNTLQPVKHADSTRVAPAHTDAINTPTVQRTTTVPKPRHRANLPANMAYNETNIYPGVSPPRENVYLCAKTRKRWERQRLRLRERTRVAGKRKYTCPLQE